MEELKADLSDWHVTIMGNGEVERFQAMAHNMDLDDSVTFTGYITGKQKEDVWNKAIIYCMCSRMRVSLWWYWKSGQEVLL